tara:strand:- start:2205 stop:3296 length:1092 start_codon:yes stop_codon:yes gene_type:complete
MKYYESSFDDYIQSVEKHNIHPELYQTIAKFPDNIYHMENSIIYGPSGIGKYSQALNILKRYSQSSLKYDKRITVATDKQQYIYRISDIHYEVDMSLLGCNSKTLWHEIFFQIVDIISVKPTKIGIILCKNFQNIHSELLDIFYSYMQQYNHSHTNIYIKFMLITEQISFLPYTIINNCNIIKISKPLMEEYKYIATQKPVTTDVITPTNFVNRVSQRDMTSMNEMPTNHINQINPVDVMSIKELRYFNLLNNENNNELPEDIFNIVCDKIIDTIGNLEKDKFIEIREDLYNILTYNLDVSDCIWTIISYFINNGQLNSTESSQVIDKTYTFLKYYNNNYRPIYHLESMLFYIINKIYKLDEN